MTSEVNIALVDDHRILVDGLDALLSRTDHYRVIAKCDSGESFINHSQRAEVDVLIMDINMKGKDGIQIFRELRSTGFQGKCIFLSSYEDLRLVNESIEIGADGYITKGNETECLEQAIEIVSKGERYYSPDIRQSIIRAFTRKDDAKAEAEHERSAVRQLTERELEVLKLIAQQYTSEEIAKKLYIARSTVDTYRKNLISKLKVRNAVGLGLFAERNQLI